jgi:molybdopterin converting factor subunit 1
MTVTVLLFASYADVFGSSEVDVAVEPGATVGEVVRQLAGLAGGAQLPPRPVVAVNQSYATYDQRVESGDEIAVIPPVAGG